MNDSEAHAGSHWARTGLGITPGFQCCTPQMSRCRYMANRTRALTAHCACRFAAPGCCSGFPPAFHVPFHSTSIIAPPPVPVSSILVQSGPILSSLAQSASRLPSSFFLASAFAKSYISFASCSPLDPNFSFPIPPIFYCTLLYPSVAAFFYCYCCRYCYCYRYRCRYQDRWPLIVLNYTVLVPHQLDPRQLRQHQPYIETTNYAIFTMTDAELDRDWVPNGRRPLSYVFSYPLLWSMPLLPKLNWHGGV